jgi:uncharacterized LabA/DUF88 family protein
MKKIAVFADVQNIYYTVRDTFGCNFNYRELWRQLSLQGDVILANAYATNRNDSQQQGFQKALRSIGFNVKLKPFIQRSDGSAKGDWDVGIAVDMMDAALSESSMIDTIVLLSGDGDFDVLLQRINGHKKISTIVFGVRALTAISLIDSASKFNPIEGDLLLN